MQSWIQELRQLGPPNLVLAIAGNKLDISEARQVWRQGDEGGREWETKEGGREEEREGQEGEREEGAAKYTMFQINGHLSCQTSVVPFVFVLHV